MGSELLQHVLVSFIILIVQDESHVDIFNCLVELLHRLIHQSLIGTNERNTELLDLQLNIHHGDVPVAFELLHHLRFVNQQDRLKVPKQDVLGQHPLPYKVK